ncbi:hypothetical protein O3Q51_03190 [Cryomorphaceae bacterium 1068]|nr:hypothetical protein [Cryomorphaceae bacterium 1068]
MAEKDLTDAQVSLVIDFLKRWGIDSPELVFELTDHYCEEAKERMEEGWSFEEVLDSWKTKKHFLSLKKIQSEFERSFKEQWTRSQIKALKTVFTSTQLLWLSVCIGAVLFATYCGFGIEVLGLSAALSVVYYIGFGYFYWIKKYQRIFEIRDNLVGGLIYYWTIYHFIKSAESDGFAYSSDLFQWKTVLVIIVVILSFYQYNLYSKLWQKLKGLTEEYLVEPNKYQVR